MSIELASYILTLLALIGGVIARDRQLMNKITEGDSKCHDRINDIPDKYAQKKDIALSMEHLAANMAGMQLEQQATNKRIDEVLTILINKK